VFTGFVGFYKTFGRDLFGSFGKWLVLLNDRSIMHIPAADMLELALPRAGEAAGLSQDVINQLLQIWRPVHEYVSGYRFCKDPWQTPVAGLCDAAEKIARRCALAELGISEPQPIPKDAIGGYNHEVTMFGAGLIETVGLWLTLNSSFPCTFIGDESEHAVLNETLRIGTPGPLRGSSEKTFAMSLPDLTAVSWETILGLRSSPLLDAFRRKLGELQDMLPNGNENEIRDLLREVELQDLRALAISAKPRPGLASLKGIIGNVPLPLPINPASLGFSIVDTVVEHRRKKQFGWLYFLFELQDAVAATHHQNS
jgi:hypothetical protein